MYEVRCDNEACRAVVQQGEGQPRLEARQRVYCGPCMTYVAQVEAILREEAHALAIAGVQRIEARRAELMAAAFPVSRGGSGEGIPSGWPKVTLQ